MYKRKNPWFLSALIMLPFIIYLFSSWWCWWFGGGFGMRPMIDYYPLFIIPIGEILSNKIPYKRFSSKFHSRKFCVTKLISNIAKKKWSNSLG